VSFPRIVGTHEPDLSDCLCAVYAKKSNQSRKGFEFPTLLAELFGKKKGKPFALALTITRPTGEVVFHGLAPFTSGAEIREAGIFRDLDYDDEIRVTASKAPTPRKKSR